jgi:hypothetical protein
LSRSSLGYQVSELWWPWLDGILPVERAAM